MIRDDSLIRIKKDIIRFERLFHNLRNKQGRLEKMLSTIKWPLPGHIGASTLDDIADSYLSGTLGQIEVEEIFVELYRRARLEDLLIEWEKEPFLTSRLPILCDALWAHKVDRYNLSVPVIMTQIEGFIAEALQHKGFFYKCHLEQYLNDITKHGTRFEKYIADFIVSFVWTNFERGEPLPVLSRHAILHGADLTYGTASNSLRIILTFNSLQSSVRSSLKYLSLNSSE